MIIRLYANNYRCFQNFDLALDGLSSALLMGLNGSGKTTLGRVLRVFQQAARGNNRVKDLIKLSDETVWNPGQPIRLTLVVRLNGSVFEYDLAFELPEGFREFRVSEEKLIADDKIVFQRSLADVRLEPSQFRVDWHLLALPIIQARSEREPLAVFRQWLRRMLILDPIPEVMIGESDSSTLEPQATGADIGAWFGGLMAHSPASYKAVDRLLQQVMPDLVDIQNPLIGTEGRRLELRFAKVPDKIRFQDLSSGEKCFLLYGLVLAARETGEQVFCFWDEPDAHLALSEVGPLMMELRRAFQKGGQLITTSHSGEVARKFGDETTLILSRPSHVEPTIVRRLADLNIKSDVVDEMTYGMLAP